MTNKILKQIETHLTDRNFSPNGFKRQRDDTD